MLALLLAPVYLLVILYILRWSVQWLETCHRFFRKKAFRICYITIYFTISCSLLTAFLIREPHLNRILKQISNYWLGCFLYILLTVAVFDLVRFILRHTSLVPKRILNSPKTFVFSGLLAVSAVLLLSVYGILNARRLTVTSYEVDVPKSCGSMEAMDIVLAADLHLGYSTGSRHVEQMVREINAMEPDLVCIAGDIFDNEFDAVDNPSHIAGLLRDIQSRYGTYACLGNHDAQEVLLGGFTFFSGDKKEAGPEMLQFLSDSGIRLLEDEVVCVDGLFYLGGRKDYSICRKNREPRETPVKLLEGLAPSLPLILMDHQPRELEELSSLGVDLDLSGHTHDGQMFPGNLTVGLMWENPCGYLKKGGMHSVVTSGAGVWGPNMRVGTRSEIVRIHVRFTGRDHASASLS